MPAGDEALVRVWLQLLRLPADSATSSFVSSFVARQRRPRPASMDTTSASSSVSRFRPDTRLASQSASRPEQAGRNQRSQTPSRRLVMTYSLCGRAALFGTLVRPRRRPTQSLAHEAHRSPLSPRSPTASLGISAGPRGAQLVDVGRAALHARDSSDNNTTRDGIARSEWCGFHSGRGRAQRGPSSQRAQSAICLAALSLAGHCNHKQSCLLLAVPSSSARRSREPE